MAVVTNERRTDAVRRFNRFYTRQIGVLQEKLLDSPFSLAEARVIYELANREKVTAVEIGTQLGLDAGYLSRLLGSFEKRGLLEKKRSEDDGRQNWLALTASGRDAFASIDSRSRDEIDSVLGALSQSNQIRLADAMKTIEGLLGGDPLVHHSPYLLRTHQPGDLGWVVHRHGFLYAREYGWNQEFEALVAEIVAAFARNFNPAFERCWIAEKDDRIVGSVFLVEKSETVGQLRLLLVEPEARGLGIGKRLVDECIRFGRQVGYQKMSLWTNSVLVAARRLYEDAGFQLVEEESNHSFGHDLTSQVWELDL